MVGILTGIEGIVNSIGDAWEANVDSDNPEFSNALYIKMPMTLGNTEYKDAESASAALVAAINKSENGTVFEDGKPVSTSGNVAYQVVENNGEDYIRLGFRDAGTKSEFMNETNADLDGVVAYSVGGPSVLGTPKVEF